VGSSCKGKGRASLHVRVQNSTLGWVAVDLEASPLVCMSVNLTSIRCMYCFAHSPKSTPPPPPPPPMPHPLSSASYTYSYISLYYYFFASALLLCNCRKCLIYMIPPTEEEYLQFCILIYCYCNFQAG